MAHGLLSTNLNLMFPLIPATFGQSIALNCVFHWSEPGAYKSKPVLISVSGLAFSITNVTWKRKDALFMTNRRKRVKNVSVFIAFLYF